MPSTCKENLPSQRRVLNLKAVAILAGGGTLLWIGMNMLHASQVVRTGDYLRSSAEEALAEEDHRKAFDLYEQYLVLNPNDDEADEKVSQLLEDHGNSTKALQRAFQINERLLRIDSKRDDLRVRQIRIADRLGRYSDAAVHLKKMRESGSQSPDVWHFSGIVAQDTGKFFDAIEYFRRAVALPDPKPESFEFLANLITNEQHDPLTAERLLEELINDHDSATARRVRASWFMDQERPQEAIPDLWTAMKDDPTDARTNAMLLKAVRNAKSSDKSFRSEEHYRQLIAHLRTQVAEDADEVGLRQYLSSALWAVGDRDEAIKNLEEGIQRDPRQTGMQEVLVDYLVSDRRYDKAQEVFAKIPARSVDRGRREFMKGRLLMSQKQWPKAIEAFEMALGFAQSDPGMSSRARVCLALCRRESGDNARAMDDYRSLMKSNPDFEGGRLGMASAYLRSEQTGLAIAEYRQLLHVEGVPEFLANLMIKHILTMPKASRDWSEVEEIVSDTNPKIKDEMQRVLLQADLMFAKGYPSQAMDLLDAAGHRMPGRPEIARAYQRLSAVHGDQLLERISKVLDEDPANVEAHSSMLRMFATRKDSAGLTNYMNGMATNRTYPRLNDRKRLEILAQTSTAVADAEISARGPSQQTQLMLQYGQEAWRRLAANSAQYTFGYVQFLAIHRSADEAMNAVNNSGQKLVPESAAVCWLECLRQYPDDQSVLSRVDSELLQLIRQESSNLNLRIAYAEHQIITKQYAAATALLQQLVKYDERNGQAFGRLAWLAAMIQNQPEDALKFSERASRFAPSNTDVRSIRGLALAQNGQTDAALTVLRAIPKNERTMASYVFEAQTLQLAGSSEAAAELLQSLNLRRSKGNLAPAEFEMLQQLQQQLHLEPTQVTSVSTAG